MSMKTKALLIGAVSGASLLGIYFLIVIAISGADFAAAQFRTYRYYMLALAAGFGIQVSLYRYLRMAIRAHMPSGALVATSGASSTAAMIACCAHYVATLAPILGASGVAAVIAGYQVQLYWIALLINAAGVAFVANRVRRFRGEVLASRIS